MSATSNRFAEIGERLRAYRMGRGLAAEQVAERLGVSRAAVYRIEAGEVVKIETLDRLASVLETSVGSLLGLGVEYYANAISYFERMRQIEEKSEQVIAHFPPLSYLLTSDDFGRQLKQTLIEAAPSYAEDGKDYEAEIDTIIGVLDERKHARHRRHLSVINFVNMPEIERWLKLGLVGRFDLPPNEIVERRLAARAEVEHLIKLIEQEPMGIQIGLIEGAAAEHHLPAVPDLRAHVAGLEPVPARRRTAEHPHRRCHADRRRRTRSPL